MFRFRVWDNVNDEYLESDVGISIRPDGTAVWYDGDPVNNIEQGRFEVEFGNKYCFHNDIVEGKIFGGSWRIERPDRYSDPVPRNHRDMFVIKEVNPDCHDIHTLYWHRAIRGVALMCPQTMQFHMAGFNCNDKFYGYEGEECSIEDIIVVGNARTDELPFCKKRLKSYKRQIELINKQKEKQNG